MDVISVFSLVIGAYAAAVSTLLGVRELQRDRRPREQCTCQSPGSASPTAPHSPGSASSHPVQKRGKSRAALGGPCNRRCARSPGVDC